LGGLFFKFWQKGRPLKGNLLGDLLFSHGGLGLGYLKGWD